jgi:hypothetical protein
MKPVFMCGHVIPHKELLKKHRFGLDDVEAVAVVPAVPQGVLCRGDP